jgi:hypothetical protein
MASLDAFVYPFGEDLLAVECDGRRKYTWDRLDQLGLRLHQCGDGERTYLFPAARWDDVAALVRPRKRKRLTEAQRLAKREMMLTRNPLHSHRQVSQDERQLVQETNKGAEVIRCNP